MSASGHPGVQASDEALAGLPSGDLPSPSLPEVPCSIPEHLSLVHMAARPDVTVALEPGEVGREVALEWVSAAKADVRRRTTQARSVRKSRTGSYQHFGLQRKASMSARARA